SASRVLEYLAADSNGELVFAGGSRDFIGVIVKYSANGVPLWTNNPVGWLPAGLGIDSDGNVLALFRASDGFTITKYASDGGAVWTNRTFQFGPYYIPQAITTDSRGSVYVAAKGGFQTNSLMTVKL